MEDEEAQVGGGRKKHEAQAFPRLSAPWSHAAKKTPTHLLLAHTRLSYHCYRPSSFQHHFSSPAAALKNIFLLNHVCSSYSSLLYAAAL